MLLSAFSRLLMRLLPLILALCAAVPAFGGRQIQTRQEWGDFGFSNCTLPCYAGITPGVTPFDDIYALLIRNVPLLDRRMIASGASLNFWAWGSSQRLSGLIRYDRKLVGEMRLDVVLPLSAVMAQLGTPDCILPNSRGEPEPMTVIFWEREQVSIGAVLKPSQHRINVNGDTLALWLHTAVPGESDCSLRGARPWRGFAPLWAYSN